MIATICLIILVLAVLNKPVGKLLKNLKDVDWKALAQNAWIYNKIKGKITLDIELIVERILDDWFGCEISYVK